MNGTETRPDREGLQPSEPSRQCYWALGLLGLSVLCVQIVILGPLLVRAPILPFPPGLRYLLYDSFELWALVPLVVAPMSWAMAFRALCRRDPGRVERRLMKLTILVDVVVLVFVFVLVVARLFVAH